MIQLNELQAEFLKACFEEVFDENEKYFDLIDIDEIYAVLIGDDSDPEFYTKLEQTATIDDRNFSFIIFVMTWMEMIESITVKLEYFELSANAIELKKEITKITQSI